MTPEEVRTTMQSWQFRPNTLPPGRHARASESNFDCPRCGRFNKSKSCLDAHYFKQEWFNHDGQHKNLQIFAAPEAEKLCKVKDDALIQRKKVFYWHNVKL